MTDKNAMFHVPERNFGDSFKAVFRKRSKTCLAVYYLRKRECEFR